MLGPVEVACLLDSPEGEAFLAVRVHEFGDFVVGTDSSHRIAHSGADSDTAVFFVSDCSRGKQGNRMSAIFDRNQDNAACVFADQNKTATEGIAVRVFLFRGVFLFVQRGSLFPRRQCNSHRLK
jgi:hypothetical protein